MSGFFTLSRRQWLQAAGTGSLSLALPSVPLLSQSKPSSVPFSPPNRYPRMVQDFYIERVRAAERTGLEAQARLQTKADADAYVRTVREKVARCFGPFPEKTPLNAKVTGTLKRDAYTIEKVIFESRPGFLVTANLYLPKGAKGPRPGVVGSCGHSVTGKSEAFYQSFCQGLARMGYVVLIFDPIGQGERFQYPHVAKPARPSIGVGEHLLAGNQQFLVGEFFGSWRAWDGIRALDYLLSRPEVDPKHVGITGNSGGGTMTTWLCGLDSRWTMAAPGCFVTTFRRNLENELPADTEQCPPHCLAMGLDHADFLAAMAPKPVMILAKEKDYFDVRGAEEAYRRLRRLYRLFGAEANVKLQVGPTAHGYSQENREAMYQWFNRVTEISDAKTEPAIALEKDEALWCTPTGQVADLRSRTVFSFTREKAVALSKTRGLHSADELKKTLTTLLRLPSRSGPPDYRIPRLAGDRKYPLPYATTYVLESESNVGPVVCRLSSEPHLSRPTRETRPAILYVSHHSADAALREEPLVGELLKSQPDAAIYACDVRGVGESRPDTCGGPNQFLTPYGNDYFYAIHGIMLDRPYVGQKTFDVLRVLDWLAAIGHREVHLAAKAWGSIPAVFAAVLSDAVTRVTLKHALVSYMALASSETYAWPLSAFVPGALSAFDLPDCYRVLAAKKLRLIEPWGADGKVVEG